LLVRCPDGVRPGYDGLRLVVDEASGDIVAADAP